MGGCYSSDQKVRGNVSSWDRLQQANKTDTPQSPSLSSCTATPYHNNININTIINNNINNTTHPQNHQHNCEAAQCRESPKRGTPTSTPEERPMAPPISTWDRPKLTIVTEMNADEEETKLTANSFVDGNKYAATPVVAVTPFAARDSRMLAVSIFQERFGKHEHNGEGEKTSEATQTNSNNNNNNGNSDGNGSGSGEVKEKEKGKEKKHNDKHHQNQQHHQNHHNNQRSSLVHGTPLTHGKVSGVVPLLKPEEIRETSLDNTVLGSPPRGSMDETMRPDQGQKVKAPSEEKKEKKKYDDNTTTTTTTTTNNNNDDKDKEDDNGNNGGGVKKEEKEEEEDEDEEYSPAEQKKPAPLMTEEFGETPRTGKRHFFIFRRSQKDPSNSEKKKEKGKEKEKDKKSAKSSVEEKPVEPEPKSPTLTREQVIQVGWQRLQERLDELKLVEHRVKDDGNCQFRAIAQQLLGSEEYHELVRAHIVTYMKSVRDRFDCYFPSKEEADNYYKELLRQGSWGDELTLRAASDSLFINIHVLSSEQQNFYITYRPGTDAPPPPAFLIDVATLREHQQQQRQQQQHQQQQQQQQHHNQHYQQQLQQQLQPQLQPHQHYNSLSLSHQGHGLVDDIGESFSSYNGSPNQLPVFAAVESVIPQQNTKTEDNEDSMVDACALQRCLQRKLATSTIRTTATPVVDKPMNSSYFPPGLNGSDSRLASDFIGYATPADPPCRVPTGVGTSGIDMSIGDNHTHNHTHTHTHTHNHNHNNGCGGGSGGVNMSFETASVPASSVNNSTQEAHLLSASQDIAKFYAMGAEKMDNTKQQQLIVLIPSSTIVTNTGIDSHHQQQQQQQNQNQNQSHHHRQNSEQHPQQQFDSSGSVQSVPSAPPGQISRSFILFPHGTKTNNNNSNGPGSGCDQITPRTHSPQFSFDLDTSNINGLNSVCSPPEEDQRVCFTFEAHSEPIDVFLSYLSPVHYNALSLAECHLSSQNQQNKYNQYKQQTQTQQTQQQLDELSSGGVMPRPCSYCALDPDATVPFLRKSVSANAICQR